MYWTPNGPNNKSPAPQGTEGKAFPAYRDALFQLDPKVLQTSTD
jgi:hypothetical protein